MNKIISILLATIISLLVVAVPAYAAETPDVIEKDFLFEHLLPKTEFVEFYDEVYYHYADGNNSDRYIDWAIVNFRSSPNISSSTVVLVSDYVITSGNLYRHYPVGWAVYDAELNEIISIDEIEVSKYNGFEEGLIKAGVGNPFGDADLDGELSVLDATYIQRVLAELCEFKENDEIQGNPWGTNYNRPLNFISDIDGDGERTVLDATTIQKKLAQVE